MAEEIILGSTTSPPAPGSDLPGAAELARTDCQPRYGQKAAQPVFPHDDGMMIDRLIHERDYSDETAKVIDDDRKPDYRSCKSRAARYQS